MVTIVSFLGYACCGRAYVGGNCHGVITISARQFTRYRSHLAVTTQVPKRRHRADLQKQGLRRRFWESEPEQLPNGEAEHPLDIQQVSAPAHLLRIVRVEEPSAAMHANRRFFGGDLHRREERRSDGVRWTYEYSSTTHRYKRRPNSFKVVGCSGSGSASSHFISPTIACSRGRHFVRGARMS